MGSVVLAELVRFGPDRCERLAYADASAYVRSFARSHRENFHVLSGMLPRRLRDDFAAVYAFCRWSDDLADEAGGPQASVPLLGWWGRELRDCFEGRPRHPVFVTLRETVRRHDLPSDPFLDLLDAFRQDQTVVRYATWEDLLEYCRRSANPVGRLVLMLCGHRDALRLTLADDTCTALQLANFWQDVRRDVLDRDRVYLPGAIAARHGLDLDEWADAVRRHAAAHSARGGGALRPDVRAAFRATLRDLTDRAQVLFDQGRALHPLLGRDVRPAVQLFSLGGQAVLRRIRRMGYDTWAARPRVGRVTRARLLMRAWLASKGVPA